MSGSLGAVIYGELRALADQVATSIANIAAARAEATANRDSINSNTNTARDNINAVTNAARDNVKSHVSAAVGAIPSSAIKAIYNLSPTVTIVAGNGGTGGAFYADVPINAVNLAKAFIVPQRSVVNFNGIAVLTYRFISSTVVRFELTSGSGSASAGQAWYISFTIVEFN